MIKRQSRIPGKRLILPRSPLAPKQFPTLGPILGVELKTGKVGKHYGSRHNLLMAILTPGTTVAGCLTKSSTASAPVVWCRRHLPLGEARALVVNAGNANVFSGNSEHQVVHNTAQQAATLLGCRPEHIFVASTGIIGTSIPATQIADALPSLVTDTSSASWKNAATAIMTTDTFPKAATRQTTIDQTPISINGIVKGSGMIAPNMATMLAFLFTDARLSPHLLQTLVSASVDQTFNCITVDGETSTSDTVLVFATGTASHPPIDTLDDPRLDPFRQALCQGMHQLAQQIVYDGEGAQKHITLSLTGAISDPNARRIGLAIANSPLVKTAIAGGDPNWGRIIMALGKSEEPVDRDKISLSFGEHSILRHGQLTASYDPSLLRTYLEGRFISISLDLGLGTGTSTLWTCDLTEGYIRINAHYPS